MADLLGCGLPRLVRLQLRLRPRSAGEATPSLVFLLVAHAALAATGALWIAAVWWVALATSFMAGFHVPEMCEHSGRVTHRIDAGLLERWLIFPHNTWYHAEHHEHPAVPLHLLPAVRRLEGNAGVRTAWDVLAGTH